MRALTPDLEAILKSKFQAGAHGFRGRIEIDSLVVTPPTGDQFLANAAQLGIGSPDQADGSWFDGDDTTWATLPAFGGEAFWESGRVYGDGHLPGDGAIVTIDHLRLKWSNLAQSSEFYFYGGHYSSGLYQVGTSYIWTPLLHAVHGRGEVGWPAGTQGYTDATGTFVAADWSIGYYTGDYTFDLGALVSYQFWRLVAVGGGSDIGSVEGYAAATEGIVTTHFRPTRISLDKSRKMAAAQLEFTITNESGEWSRFPSQDLVVEDRIVRAYEWFGDVANEVKVFTGLIDKPHEHRDPRTITVSCRDRMKLLLVQGFQASAPQGADEDGAVRTTANGVYLNMEVSAIVDDILDQAGITTGGRSIFPTSYMVDEYIIPDGSTWADAIAGTDRLTDLTGYELWADEDGVITFAPAGQLAPTDTDTARTPDYTFRVGEDLIAIDLEGDDYDVKTRIKATGPQTTAKPAWAETWHTNAIARPVGLFYDPADPTHLYVLDRSTAKLYKLLQSDRSIVSSVAFAGISHPTGISGDPSDATIVWILEAPWAYGGSTSGNSIKKVRRSDGATLATYALADGRWTTIKASSTFLWLGNWDTDKIHRFGKDGTAIASYTVVYESVAQANPSGIAIDGTTLLTFFYGMSGGNRFLLVDESDPTTVDPTNALGVTSGVVSTAGTNIIGGEMDTTTHADLYACSDALGLVWKFALTTPTTDTVAVVVADQELEDLLGDRSQTAARTHDLHPGDAAHSFEVRRGTLALKVVTSVAQATESATRALNVQSQFRLVLDAGVVGNPALQLRDMIAVEDPLSSLDETTTFWLLDTYRTELDAEAGTYVGTVSLLPWAPVY